MDPHIVMYASVQYGGVALNITPPAATVTTVTINATSATATSYTNTTTAKTSSTCPPSKRGRVCGIHVKGVLLQRCN